MKRTSIKKNVNDKEIKKLLKPYLEAHRKKLHGKKISR